MSLFQAVLLGLIRGLTEFLPVSGSGHLVLGQYLLNVQNPDMLSFGVSTHFGTLISVCIIFRKDVAEIAQALLHAVRTKALVGGYKTNEQVRLGTAVIIGTIPSAIIGLMYHDQIAEAFGDPKLVAVAMLMTGLVLFLTRFMRNVKPRQLGMVSGFIVGLAQSLAVLPGISRSGSTISAGLFLRLSPVMAARFSFLLSIPIIAGAVLFESRNLIRQGVEIGVGPFLVSMVVAAITGYFAIKILLRIIERGRFSWFAFYCLAAGIAGIFLI